MIGYIISAVLGLLTILGMYTKVIFDYATIKANLMANTTILRKIELLLEDYDSRMDRIENRVIVLETQHKQNHKE